MGTRSAARRVGVLGSAILGVAFAGSAALALAGEVVHFKNGTYLVVESHEVEGTMLRVRVGREGYLAFPLALVEKIEQGGSVISGASLVKSRANQVVSAGALSGPGSAGSGVGGSGAAAEGGHSSRARRSAHPGSGPDPVLLGNYAAQALEPQPQHSDGIQRPFADHPNPNRRRITTTGNFGYEDRGGPQQLDATGKPLRKFKPLTLQPKPVGLPSPPPAHEESAPSGSSGAGESDAGD